MPQFPNPPGQLKPVRARRSPTRYRAVQTGPATNFVTERIVGMWVPAEAFGRGAVLQSVAGYSTGNATMEINLGGEGTTSSAGVQVVAMTSGNATTRGHLRALQIKEGMIVEYVEDASGEGAVSTGGSDESVSTAFVQPLNFVESATVAGTTNAAGHILEVWVATNVYPPVDSYAELT